SKVGRSRITHVSRVHTKLLPVYSSQTADAKILIPSTLRYLRARSADIPQPKSRTVRTFCAAPHTRYDEPRLWHRKCARLLDCCSRDARVRGTCPSVARCRL